MGRIRTIKPEFASSESMGKVSHEARLLFVLTWTLADDSGRLRGNSRLLARTLYPYDDDQTTLPSLVEGWLNELSGSECIIRYEVDGQSYIEIVNWLSHQKIDKPTPSKIPPPPSNSTNSREDSRGVGEESRGLAVGGEGKGMEIEGEGSREEEAPALLEKPETQPLLDYCRELARDRGAHDIESYAKALAKKPEVIADYKRAYPPKPRPPKPLEPSDLSREEQARELAKVKGALRFPRVDDPKAAVG